MFDKVMIEKLLSINGIPVDASDEDVRIALRKAKWRDEEIDVALKLVRNETSSGLVALEKNDIAIFRPGVAADPKKLSKLLGVDVIVDPRMLDMAEYQRKSFGKRLFSEVFTWLFVILVALVFAIIIVWLSLYTMEMGPYSRPPRSFL